jgi:preprotein translocase subunit SecD
LYIEHVEKNLSDRVTVVVIEKEKEELGTKEICIRRVGVKMIDIRINGVKNARIVDIGVSVV